MRVFATVLSAIALLVAVFCLGYVEATQKCHQQRMLIRTLRP